MTCLKSQIWSILNLGIKQESFFFFKEIFLSFFLAVLIFVPPRELSLVAASGRLLSSCGAQASQSGSFYCCRAQALGSWASVVVARGLSCSAVHGIFLVKGSNPCPLQWQEHS